VNLLGPNLVSITGDGDDCVYRSVTSSPDVIELSYYANALLPAFALDGIVGEFLLIFVTGYSF